MDYTDNSGNLYEDADEIFEAIRDDLYPHARVDGAIRYAMEHGAANADEALDLVCGWHAPLRAYPNVGLSADYVEDAYIIAGSLGSPHVVVFDDSLESDERPYIILHNLGGDDDHPKTVAGPFASPAEAVAAAREFAASVGLL
jgi:hypothetical protein